MNEITGIFPANLTYTFNGKEYFCIEDDGQFIPDHDIETDIITMCHTLERLGPDATWEYFNNPIREKKRGLQRFRLNDIQKLLLYYRSYINTFRPAYADAVLYGRLTTYTKG